MSSLGNDETIAAIIERVATVLDERRARQDAERLRIEKEAAAEKKETRRWLGGNIWGWLAACSLVIGIFVTGSDVRSIATTANARSLNNENAIASLKADNGDRLARIETKIDLMMEERKR